MFTCQNCGELIQYAPTNDVSCPKCGFLHKGVGTKAPTEEVPDVSRSKNNAELDFEAMVNPDMLRKWGMANLARRLQQALDDMQRRPGAPKPAGGPPAELGAPTDEKPRHPSAVTLDKVRHWFTYHPPAGQEDIDAYQGIREAGGVMALEILRLTPPGADQTVAIRKIREAVMTANAARACKGL